MLVGCHPCMSLHMFMELGVFCVYTGAVIEIANCQTDTRPVLAWFVYFSGSLILDFA